MRVLASSAAIAVLGMAAVLPADEPSGVVFSVALPDELIVDDANRFGIQLRLSNSTDQPLYVSPVIGQLEGHLKILARRQGATTLPAVLYDKKFTGGGRDLDDLFRLLPGRTLRLDLDVSYPEDALTRAPGLIEIWAEYDCTGMKRLGDRALAVSLASERAVAPVVFAGAAPKRSSGGPGKAGSR
jgi:hypothetical protein